VGITIPLWTRAAFGKVIPELSAEDATRTLRPATFAGSKTGSGYPTNSLAFKRIADDSPDMSAPRFQSFFAFGEEIVALINGCDSRNCATLVIEYLVRDVRGDPEPRHPGYAGSS
jgi:hypothetical protein